MPHASNSEFVAGGGLALDDVDCVMTNFRYTTKEEGLTEYSGEFGEEPCLAFTGVIDGDEEEHAQVLSCGNKNDFKASKSGEHLDLIGKATRMRSSCNAALFLKSLIDHGVSPTDLDSGVSYLDGIHVHVQQEDISHLRNFKDRNGEEKGYAPTALIVSDILDMPGDKKKKPGKAGKAAPGKAAPKKAGKKVEEEDEQDEDTQLADAVTLALLEILNEADEQTLKRKAIPGKIAIRLPSGVSKAKALTLATSVDFLSSDDAPWTFDEDEGTLSL